MKLSFSLLVLAAFCVFPRSGQAGTGHWDPHVSFDSIVIAPGILAGAGIMPANLPVATAEVKASTYQRIALQSEMGGAVSAEAAGIKITPPRLLFILATDLEIIGAGSKASASALAKAFSSASDFRKAILPFLKNWRHPKDTTRTLEGLPTVAKFIASEHLPTTTAWRFGVSPIPAEPGRPKLASSPVFEIRLIINVDDLGLTTGQRSEVEAQLVQMGRNNVEFLKAVGTLRAKVCEEKNARAYPYASALLDDVFPGAK